MSSTRQSDENPKTTRSPGSGTATEPDLPGKEGTLLLLRRLPIPAFVIQDGRTVFANQPCADYLQRTSPDEIVGLTTDDVIHPDDRALALERDLRMRASRVPEPPIRLRFLRADGSVVSAECHPLPLEAGDGTAVLVLCRDATSRESADDRFRHLLDALPEPVVVHRDARVLFANPAAGKLLGFEDVDALLLRDLNEFLHPDHLAESSARVRTMLETGEPAPLVEFRVKHVRGHYLTVEVAAMPIRFAGRPAIVIALRDVSERRAASEAMRRSAESFRALIEKLPVPVSVHREGRVLFANTAAARLLGFEPSELVGSQTRAIFGFDASSGANRITDQEGRPQGSRLLTKDGEAIDVESTAFAMEWEGAQAALLITEDLRERRSVHAKLLEADRMASIGTLAAGIAHEINNPLSYVMANVRYAIDAIRPLIDREGGGMSPGFPEDGSDPIPILVEVLDSLDEARDGAQRIRDVVHDVRTFSRGTETTTPRTDVREVLQAAINMARNEIRHRARLVRHFGKVPAVEANESRLSQAFLNLLMNAAQALPVGGAKQNEIRVTTRTDAAGSAVVEIADTGPGIPESIRERVFEPFFTTKPSGVGTGLGLAICRNIVTAAGGRIDVESDDRNGSTFTVTLPAAEPDADRPRSSSPTARRTADRARVLIIDDEPAVARALRRDLARAHDVLIAHDGREAVDLLADVGDFDIIFCDLMMPDVTGMDVYAAVKARRPELVDRFVFMTGGAFTESAREFLAAVDNVCLDKPFDPDEVRRLVLESISDGVTT